MPFTTVLATLNLEFSSEAVKLREPARLSRVAGAISLSEGEFIRVKTFPEGGPESFGKT